MRKMAALNGLEGLLVKRAASKLDIKSLLEVLRRSGGSGGTTQAFSAKFPVSRRHLLGAYANAMRAFSEDTNRTRSPGLEMLLYAAMTSQIKDALLIAGVKEPSDFIILSDDKRVLAKLGKVAKIGGDFDTTLPEMRRRAISIGIDAGAMGREQIDAEVLRRMALAMLSAD